MRYFSIVLLGAWAFVFTAMVQVGWSQDSTGAWLTRAPMPTARKEISNATVAISGRVYVVGGVARNGQITNALEIYDPTADVWRTGTSLPVRVWRASAAAANGKLYVFGGYASTAAFPFSPTNRVFEYDPEADSWQEKTAMPTARSTTVAVTVGGKIHVLGGAANTALNLHQIYDPVNDSWSTAAPIPSPRSGLTATVIGDEILVAGGYILAGGVVSQRVLEIYSVTNQSWRSGTNMPIARLGIAAVTVRNKMYVFGGLPNSGTSLTLEYDPAADGWRTLADMPTPVSFMGAAVVKDTVYVVGGGPVNLNRFDGVSANRVFVPPNLVTSVGARIEQPKTFQLSQNFPNPFNPTTNIAYRLLQPGSVRLDLFNLQGAHVRTLVEARQARGDYNIRWDGRDNQERDVASGIYIYRLKSPVNVESRRMLLLR